MTRSFGAIAELREKSHTFELLLQIDRMRATVLVKYSAQTVSLSFARHQRMAPGVPRSEHF